MIDNIEIINQKIKEYYDNIKLSGKIQNSFILEEFINEIKEKFEYIDNQNPEVDEGDIFQQLFDVGLTKSEILNDFKKNISDIEDGIKEIKNNFEKRKEIFLSFDFFRESQLLSITLNNINKKYPGYLGTYYILALKSLLVLWKNEINLLDESMSFHHREKSKLDIKKVRQILKEGAEKQENLEKGKEILTEILEYSEFLCFKFNIIDKIELVSNYKKNYKDFINVIDFINKIEKSKEKEDINIENINENDVKNELNLFKYFLYLKDYRYKKEPEKSYKKLKNTLKNHNFKENINIIFFINNLISLLNKISEKGNKELIYSEEIEFINNFIDEKNISETYFTKYKFAQLYKNLGKLNKNVDNFKTSEDNINESIKKFEEQNGAYYPFIATSGIFYEKNEKVFSFSTFIQSQKTDYYLRIKQEQIKILEEKSELKLSLKIDEVNKKIKNNDNIIKEQEDKINNIIKEQEDKIDNKLVNNNIKTIELLAIFSAIIMFTSGSIQIFQYVSNISQAMLIIFGFAFSINLFIFGIIFLFGELDKFKRLNERFFYFIIIIFLLFLLAIVFLVNKDNLLNKEYKDKIKEEIINDLEKTKNLLKI